MKVVAHPLVVAAALGLLGPEALEGFSEPEERDERTCTGCSEEPEEPEEAEVAFRGTVGAFGPADETLFTVDAPSHEDLARVAREWATVSRT